MDSFMNLAKQGLDAYQKSQSDVSKTGGAELNSPHHSQSSHGDGPALDHDEVVKTAEAHGSGDSSLFSSALGFLSDNKQAHSQPVDEEHVINAHKEAYENNNAGSLSAHSLGSAAALQALKKFTSGGSSSSGGSSQSQLIAIAMSEASKLFDSSGGAASGNKQDAVNGAAMTVMKLFVQSKFSGSGTIGGGESGGLGSLLSLASKFTK